MTDKKVQSFNSSREKKNIFLMMGFEGRIMDKKCRGGVTPTKLIIDGGRGNLTPTNRRYITKGGTLKLV